MSDVTEILLQIDAGDPVFQFSHTFPAAARPQSSIRRNPFGVVIQRQQFVQKALVNRIVRI